jgi:hypothetical protein
MVGYVAAYAAAKSFWLQLPGFVRVVPMSLAAVPLLLQASPAYMPGPPIVVAPCFIVAAGAALAFTGKPVQNLGYTLAGILSIMIPMLLVVLSRQATANIGHRYLSDMQRAIVLHLMLQIVAMLNSMCSS